MQNFDKIENLLHKNNYSQEKNIIAKKLDTLPFGKWHIFVLNALGR